jgi:uncharacterized protein (TIGR03086 family)
MTPSPRQTSTAVTDPRPLLLRAADQAARLVALATPQDAQRPTPCSEFDVAHLVGHLIAVVRRITYVTGGGQAFDVPSIVLDVEPADWAATITADRQRLASAWADDAVLDRVLHLPFGDVPGRGAAMAYVEEMTTHAWDLARAIGREDLLDDALAQVAVAAAKQFIPDVKRGEIPFGPVVVVGPDAAPYDQLVAWLGRDPYWTAP